MVTIVTCSMRDFVDKIAYSWRQHLGTEGTQQTDTWQDVSLSLSIAIYVVRNDRTAFSGTQAVVGFAGWKLLVSCQPWSSR